MRKKWYVQLFVFGSIIVILGAGLWYYPPLWQTVELEPQTYYADNRLDLNTATQAQLTALPGIGEAKAKAIILYRLQNGGFTSKDQLLEVKGISQKLYDAIEDYLYL